MEVRSLGYYITALSLSVKIAKHGGGGGTMRWGRGHGGGGGTLKWGRDAEMGNDDDVGEGR